MVCEMYNGVQDVRWCVMCTMVCQVYNGVPGVQWCVKCAMVCEVYTGMRWLHKGVRLLAVFAYQFCLVREWIDHC